ncbi:hypothetical protein CVT24_007253 [Panaeolus cyanescens]|uniref:Uncharacterized protein n=1 Tax=Panaeolus cyanescens TaxID=181874 RepID=A0A409WLI8_9AGAR|nr:hypothetical protein CVT24_007253 [Panaeolus cyanescens]
MSHEAPEHELITTGIVGVRLRSDWTDQGHPHVILLAGPTGSGKSSFIEALADDKSLGISKDQLEGFTQNVTAYHVENVALTVKDGNRVRYPVCLLDSPGFSDVNISEMEVIEQLKRCLDDQKFTPYVNIILYFCPITGTRIPGTQRRTIDMLKSLIRTQEDQESALAIVTTMWDQVCNERLQRRAEDNVKYITENTFKDMIEGGAILTTFTNTQKSALGILNTCVRCSGKAKWAAASSLDLHKSIFRITPYGQQLYMNLLGRIEDVWLRKQTLESDLMATNATQDATLNTLLRGQLQETHLILDKFATQLAEFGSAPDGMPRLQGDLAAYFSLKYEQQQQYATLLVPLEDNWRRKHFLETDIVWATDAGDTEVVAYHEDQLQQTMSKLPNLARQLVEFGPPPEGISGPQDDLAAYIERKPWLEDLQSTSLELVIKQESIRKSGSSNAASAPHGKRSPRSRFFIEALACNKSLAISKDQLEGFTQTVTGYHVKNMIVINSNGSSFQLCLLDSPGFSDARISEMEIMKQVKDWLDLQGHQFVNVILYFCPITGTRVPGSQIRTIKMLKSLVHEYDIKRGTATIVSTMWDQVGSNIRAQQRANNNYASLTENHFKDMIQFNQSTGLAKFMNTQESALEILNSSILHYNNSSAVAVIDDDLATNILREFEHGKILYANLIARIEEAWMKKKDLEFDLAQTRNMTSGVNSSHSEEPELNAILEAQLRDTMCTLHKFVIELVEFGQPPDEMSGPRGDSSLGAYIERERKLWLEDHRSRTAGSTFGVGQCASTIKFPASNTVLAALNHLGRSFMLQEVNEFELVSTGTVCVRPRSEWVGEGNVPYITLIMGPTGSGKSSFIEALANDKSLGISKDQLDGFTQTNVAIFTSAG